MKIACIYNTPREACLDTWRFFESPGDGRRLYVLPYNRFDPDKSTFWWLSPSPDNPAYKYGKFAFAIYEDNIMRTGLYVEKGLGLEYCSIDKSKSAGRMVMDETWSWHSFLRDMKGEGISQALDMINAKANVRSELHLEGGYASPGFDPQRPRFKWDRSVFQWDPGDQILTLLKENRRGEVLPKLGESITFPDLASKLSNLPESSFIWIDLLIGIRLNMSSTTPHAWDGNELVRNVLDPLYEWVR